MSHGPAQAKRVALHAMHGGHGMTKEQLTRYIDEHPDELAFAREYANQFWARMT